ncbi:MAG: peptide ABC transporter ATP-binding protein [Halobaculum sp.]
MTDERPPSAPLSIATDLSVTVDGERIDVRSTGERLFLEVPSVAVALQLLRDGETYTDDLSSVLQFTDLTVEVRVRGATVAVLGSGARAGPLSRELGVAPAEIRVGGAVAAGGREVLAGIHAAVRLIPG